MKYNIIVVSPLLESEFDTGIVIDTQKTGRGGLVGFEDLAKLIDNRGFYFKPIRGDRLEFREVKPK